MVEAKGSVAVEGDGVCNVVGRVVVATASESLFFEISGSKDVVGHVSTLTVACDPAEYSIPAKWNSERKTIRLLLFYC